MTLTAKQLEQRKKSVGSSPLPAIVLGKDSYGMTIYDEWLLYTNKIPLNLKPKEYMNFGNLAEPIIVKFAESKLGKISRRNLYRKHKELPMHAIPDGMLIKESEPVEAKNVGIYNPSLKFWGEEGTDQVPNDVIIQAHGHMICSYTEICHVAAFFGGNDFKLYVVRLNLELAEIIKERAADFWFNNVQKDIPPKDSIPRLDVIKKIQRIPDKVGSVIPYKVEYWKKLEGLKSAIDKEYKKAQADILADMGDAEAANVEGVGHLTFFEYERKRHVVPLYKYRRLYLKPKLLTAGKEVQNGSIEKT